jgi:pyruvate dehydrogenase E2 component (dihydrolipoamide acetyltransferase)
MPINILMPALSPTMEKGNLAKWLKKEGDKVAAGDIIAEIETDKATMEFEAVDEGTLAKILVPEGSTDVPVNQPIAVLAGEGEDVKAAGQSAPAQPAAQSEAKPESKSTPASPAQAPAQAAAPAAASQAPAQRPQDGANRVFASPLARRLARDKGIDIGSVAGSGPHGRVIARDLEGAQPGAPARAPAAPAAAAAAAPAARPASAEAPSDDKIRALFEPGSYEVIPHDGMRRTIARRLVEAKQTIPHFYLTIDCNIGKLLAAREEINRSAPKDKDGKPAWKLSVNDFVIKALAMALQRVPDANVTWTEGGMLKHKRSDVGVAVSIPGGLITPVIRAADIKSLSVISNEMRDLAARARARKLKPNEYEGGATAVSNLGMYGIKDFAAVINPPQATILAVGAGEERAIVRDGKIEAGWVMSATLSCDHRAVDGALGAELLSAFKALIENPLMLAV